MSSAELSTSRVPRAIVWVLLALAGLTLFGGGYVLATQRTATMDHQAAIDARSAEVMPFDLNKTTHVFQKNAAGGVQSVVAKDAHDEQQIGLIRTHLQEEAQNFSQGNYADPAAIHGMDMPGLKELQAGYTRVQVTYEDLPDGGRITYVANEPALVSAIHAWFDRQLMDHGSHAMGG